MLEMNKMSREMTMIPEVTMTRMMKVLMEMK